MGAWMAGKASRTSVVAIAAMMFRMAPGLPASRSRAPHHACITSSASGQKRRMLVPSPHRLMTSSMIALRCSSGMRLMNATAYVPKSARARVRSGYVAANSIAIGPPSW